MIRFTSLRLAGFKSFVDAADMTIAAGLTGIVGPNGCGKSNLIESLHWVMGESSARRLRGSEMDDVIFGGTANRPARNLAEVTLRLERTDDADAVEELEVTRRIERGNGSSYRLNGKEVRARDVQLLFADVATGARSSGLVSQGRVANLINAKPTDRRVLLEEAAGIAGLYTRRNEAESRLKAAETNLERLGDILMTLDEQRQSLQKQAKQAARYRTLSQQIRNLDALILHRQWLEALTAAETARATLRNAAAAVEEATRAAAVAATAQTECAARLPDLRRADQEALQAVQTLVVEREKLEAEAGRMAEIRRDLDQRIAQSESDLAREAARATEAAAHLDRLTAEQDRLLADAGADDPLRQDRLDAVEQATETVLTAETALNAALAEVAAQDAERAGLLRQRQDAETRRDRLNDRLAQLQSQKRDLHSEGLSRADLTAAEMEVEAALDAVEECREQGEELERQRTVCESTQDAAQTTLREARTATGRLKAEAEAILAVLQQGQSADHPTLMDQVGAASGYEPALAVALGDDLSASPDPAAPLHWAEHPVPELSPLPDGVPALARFVTAPAAVAARLSQIGVVDTSEQGEALWDQLRVGQRLVSRDGALWRWDGLTAKAGTPTPLAIKLAQRNRLLQLEAALDDAAQAEDDAAERNEQAAQALSEVRDRTAAARDALRQSEAELVKARADHARMAQKFAAFDSRMAALDDQITTTTDDLEEAQTQCLEIEAELTLLPVSDSGQQRVEALRLEVTAARAVLTAAQTARQQLEQQIGERKRRLDQLHHERSGAQQRLEQAKDHQQELEDRREQLLLEVERLASLPQTLERRRSALLDDLTAAEARRTQTADALLAGEQAQTEADRALRAAEQALMTVREDHIRHEAAVTAANQVCQTVAQRIFERLEITPEGLPELIGDMPSPLPSLDDLTRRHDRLNREREAMGPVNLRAEQEVAELDERITAMEAERDDLTQAIARLRNAIATLNREGRERLLVAFKQVDQHFRDLFVRLFGGGRAHLTLTDEADPLNAGLEIMASPPGKRLQSLSLLSGGEQALTALALIFAVFLINPAPICVLDEVDAPLDDANVDRFCSLVEHLAEVAQTRFLIVTHHRMTMARMNRLFGVTMAERGVSQLVSVNLDTAHSFVEEDQNRT